MKKIKAGIYGGAGYTGGEMLRILLHHPFVDIVFIHSNSNYGKPVTTVHTDLLGDTTLFFTKSAENDVDVVFLCVGHGEAKKIMKENKFSKTTILIDLSQDHRIANPDFVYGLPELNREQIKKAKCIANPGCFATAIQLGLLPIADKSGLPSPVHINAVTGSTGAGQSLATSSHFSWRQNNVSVYKAFNHQHLQEIEQSLNTVHPKKNELIFIPQRGSFTRGILASMVMETKISLANLQDIYQEYYLEHPFVWVSSTNIDLKQVVNTNKCILYLEKYGNQLCIISILDNLLKGASGQAVQNMNLIFGLEETSGLKLKGSAF